jgi:hypothetical protein
MSNRLEQFVKDNREAFDKFEPGPVVWHNIQQELKKPASKPGLAISMKTLRWSAAAAVMVLVVTAAYFFGKNNGEKEPGFASTPVNKTQEIVPKKENDSPLITKENSQEQLAVTEENKKDEPALASVTDNYDEEMYHYTRLVELKQKQITAIKKDEPLLYQKFAGDINQLDSTFHTLKKQLPVNPNREQILEAMIENLKRQEAVLNQQLNIIKQINQVKKSEYEKAHKSI